jgi:hypothetical protein
MEEMGWPEHADALAVSVNGEETVLPLYGLVTLTAAAAGMEDDTSRDAARGSQKESFIEITFGIVSRAFLNIFQVFGSFFRFPAILGFRHCGNLLFRVPHPFEKRVHCALCQRMRRQCASAPGRQPTKFGFRGSDFKTGLALSIVLPPPFPLR